MTIKQHMSEDLEWRETQNGAVPISKRFDDPYYSFDNGLEETRHVFIKANDLERRLASEHQSEGDFHVAELGFGTGLNALVLMQLWAQQGKEQARQLHFTSFEAFPMSKEQAQTALTPFEQQLPIQELLSQWPQIFQAPTQVLENMSLQVITGDARQTVPCWKGMADAWFLDGFSPAKNPELWESNLIKAVGAHTKCGATASTYSAAGHVRRSLEDAGFQSERITGFGRKRHMTIATRLANT